MGCRNGFPWLVHAKGTDITYEEFMKDWNKNGSL